MSLPGYGGAGGSTALEVDGLSEAITALRKYDREASNEVRRIMRAETNRIRDLARRRLSRTRGHASRRKTQISSKTSQRYAAIGLMRSKYKHTAVGKELGGHLAWTGTIKAGTGIMSRSPRWPKYQGFPDRLDRGRGGHAVLPTIRQELPEWEETIVSELNRVVGELLRRSGVETRIQD